MTGIQVSIIRTESVTYRNNVDSFSHVLEPLTNLEVVDILKGDYNGVSAGMLLIAERALVLEIFRQV
jgi:hypothetical protein